MIGILYKTDSLIDKLSMVLNSEIARASQDVNDIPLLYEGMMKGFAGEAIVTSPQLKEDGYFMELYAPGYENNGVAEVSAKCL